MLNDFQRIEQVTPQRRELHPALHLFFASDIFRGVRAVIVGGIGMGAVGMIAGLEWHTIGKLVLGLIVFVSVLYFLPDLLYILAKNARGIAAIIQAVAEILLQKDLNRSGGIGDVKRMLNQPKGATGRLDVESTNHANETYYRAVKILEATFVQLSKVADGEKISKPFTYRNCNKAGMCAKFEDWSNALKLWERAGIARTPQKDDWEMLVKTFEEGVGKLKDAMQQDGYFKLKDDTWMKE